MDKKYRKLNLHGTDDFAVPSERCETILADFLLRYVNKKNKGYLNFMITSDYRPNDPATSPHFLKDNAIDFILKSGNDYSPIQEYNELFEYMIDNWKYRAGIDNTDNDGNVHIHVDLGKNKLTEKPFFFIENNGEFIKQVKTVQEFRA